MRSPSAWKWAQYSTLASHLPTITRELASCSSSLSGTADRPSRRSRSRGAERRAHRARHEGLHHRHAPPRARRSTVRALRGIIAYRDPLGLEPPIIKVQCKRTTGSTGGPDVQKLMGTLAANGSELGLFVTLGSYSTDARNIGRSRQDVRLINGNEFVNLVFQHYDKFSPVYKRLLPMRSVYVVDRDSDGT
ncbi:MAG: restriction endonuclease [Thermoleophilaceae bacterium]